MLVAQATTAAPELGRLFFRSPRASCKSTDLGRFIEPRRSSPSPPLGVLPAVQVANCQTLRLALSSLLGHVAIEGAYQGELPSLSIAHPSVVAGLRVS